jgi:HSP20 family protein
MPFGLNFEPFDALRRLQDELEQALGSDPGWLGLGPSGRGVFPPVNVFGGKDETVIALELPGLTPGSINVESRGDTLTIAAKREPARPAQGSFHRRERWAGEFSRSLRLPAEVDPSNAAASYKNGVLTIRVPRREEAKPRQIAIRAS